MLPLSRFSSVTPNLICRKTEFWPVFGNSTRPEGRNPAFRFFNAPKRKQDKFVAEKASRTLIVVKMARPNYKS